MGAYPGWEEFSSKIENVYHALEGTGVIRNVVRHSVRYINFFERDIFPNLTLQITLDGDAFSSDETSLKMAVQNEQLRSVLRIRNEALLKTDDGDKAGSLIDIDTIVGQAYGAKEFFRNVSSLFDSAHDVEKRLFFRLLDQSFLESLNPEY